MPEWTVAFPRAGLAALRRAVEALDPDRGAAAIREAGRSWVDVVERSLVREPDRTLADLRPDAFWRELGRFLHHAGWGRIEHEDLGIAGALRALDWAESDPEPVRTRPGCHFSAGFLGELFTRVAGEPVEVAEVECRSKGDATCRFVYGAPGVVERLARAAADGTPVEAAARSLAASA
jgi:predicted hydrocarbon binding protein